MPRSAVWLLVATAAFFPHGAISSRVGSGTQDQKVLVDTDSVTNLQPTRKLNGKFLHITDFHPDEFYKVHTSTEEGVACHRGKGPAGTYGAETTDCDSPFTLVNSTLEWIAKNLKHEIDFVIWTGDTARHDSDEKLPRDSSHVLGSNRQVADQMVETFSENGQLEIPIIPTFGNNDFLPHNIFFPGPNRWLQYYNDIWKRFIPEEQRHSFEFGGWFEVEVIPNKLSVFSLNTMYFFDRNAGVDGCAQPSEPGYKHMEWLAVQLQRLRERGMKAILMGHVPPARTDSKQLWDETCWQKYTLWLKQFRDVVTGSVYGHMNIDHFLLQDTKDIDLTLLGQEHVRQSMEEDYSIQSKGDYLVELRESWASLPQLVARSLVDESENLEINDVVDDMGKKHKGKKHKGKKKKGKRNKNLKKIGGKYGERYHLSLVSPSVVPNYLPSIRVIEYNISGLEDSKVWTDTYNAGIVKPENEPVPWEQKESTEDYRELKRDLETEKKHKKKKGKKGRKGHKKPKYPDLVIPDGPPKGSTPGPAYSNQPFTFLGYTQYFANLTHLNNDITGSIHESKWRDGDYSDRNPKNKKPKPREFKYEIEYSTFTDKLFKLPDLTVRNYLKLAYRIAKMEKKGNGNSKAVEEVDDDFEDDEEELDVVDASSTNIDENVTSKDYDASSTESDAEEEEADSDLETEKTGKSTKRKERKQRNKEHKTNKVWIHFLNHAFVSTVSKKELKKL